MVRAFFVRQDIHVLSDDDALDFILKPFDEGDSADDDEEEEDDQGEDENNNSSDEDIPQKEEGWRFDIDGWDDSANLETLMEKLKATNPVTKE